MPKPAQNLTNKQCFCLNDWRHEEDEKTRAPPSECVAPAGRLQLPRPIKRLPSPLKLVILRCAVPASRPIEELVATVAKGSKKV